MKRWPTQPLGSFCRTGSGGTPSRGRPEYFDGGTVPWVKSGELKKSVVLSTSEKITVKAIKETNAHLVPKNAVLVAMYGATVGETSILGMDAATNQAVCHIIPDPNTAHFRFVWYALKSRLGELLSKRVGGAQPNISQGIIRDTVVPVPPLAEQERIVKLLDEADELRKLRAQADRRTAALIPALFHDMFGDPEENSLGWPSATLEELISSTKLGLVRGAKETDDSLPFPYVRMDAILGDGNLALAPTKRVNATAAEVAEFSLRNGDFLFNTRNSRELVGKTALFEGSGTYLFNNNIMRIRFNDSIEPHYMIALFQTDFIQATVGSKEIRHNIRCRDLLQESWQHDGASSTARTAKEVRRASEKIAQARSRASRKPCSPRCSIPVPPPRRVPEDRVLSSACPLAGAARGVGLTRPPEKPQGTISTRTLPFPYSPISVGRSRKLSRPRAPARAQALSCAGCHRLNADPSLPGTPDNRSDGGLVWPASRGFTHVGRECDRNH
jgi:type I restriction enzyme, S subunit